MLSPWEGASSETRSLISVFESSDSPPLHHLGVEGARAATLSASRFLQGPKPDVAQVRDLLIEHAGIAIPMRVYHPAPGDSLPLIVYVHGGGWVTGDLDVVDGPCRRLALGTQSVVVSIDYRLSPETPSPGAVADVHSTVDWCDTHRDSLGARDAGMSLIGESAGAHLIACLLVRHSIPAVTSVVLMYPPISPPESSRSGSYESFAGSPILSADTMTWFWSQHLPQGTPSIDLTDLSALRDFPRTLLISAGIDILRDEGLDFATRLRSIGTQVEVIEYPELAHGFLWMDRFIPEATSVVGEIARFLKLQGCRSC